MTGTAILSRPERHDDRLQELFAVHINGSRNLLRPEENGVHSPRTVGQCRNATPGHSRCLRTTGASEVAGMQTLPVQSARAGIVAALLFPGGKEVSKVVVNLVGHDDADGDNLVTGFSGLGVAHALALEPEHAT